jgi:hypothetical protein
VKHETLITIPIRSERDRETMMEDLIISKSHSQGFIPFSLETAVDQKIT